MKLSSQEEYGLRCLVQLGRESGGSLTIAELGQREGISAPNVAKIMRVLRKSGLVKSTRGQAGGYTLSRAPREVSIGEALAALGGRIFDAGFCDRHAGSESLCINLGDCSIRPVLRQVQTAIDEVLGRMTLESLLGSEGDVRIPANSPRAVALPVATRH
jgi:Rrf2 family protein